VAKIQLKSDNITPCGGLFSIFGSMTNIRVFLYEAWRQKHNAVGKNLQPAFCALLKE